MASPHKPVCEVGAAFTLALDLSTHLLCCPKVPVTLSATLTVLRCPEPALLAMCWATQLDLWAFAEVQAGRLPLPRRDPETGVENLPYHWPGKGSLGHGRPQTLTAGTPSSCSPLPWGHSSSLPWKVSWKRGILRGERLFQAGFPMGQPGQRPEGAPWPVSCKMDRTQVPKASKIMGFVSWALGSHSRISMCFKMIFDSSEAREKGKPGRARPSSSSAGWRGGGALQRDW